MPTRLTDGHLLPTLDEPQEQDLPDKKFQSIAESGILKESLERSRQKWINGGLFELYWSKPNKKKGAMGPGQPAKETMTRTGNCSMIIEPHVFDITLYTVKEHPFVQYPTFSQTAPSYSTFSPYSSQNGTYAPQLGPPFTGSILPDARPPSAQPNQTGLSLPPFHKGFGQLHNQPPPRPPTPTHTSAEARRTSKSSNSSQESRLREGASTDPVIQMLAQRAGQDSQLKSLMTIVAAGDASSEQLKEFQTHIDELNSLLKSPSRPPENGRQNNGLPTPPPQNPNTQPQLPPKPPVKSVTPSPPPTAASPVKIETFPTPNPYAPPVPRPYAPPSTPAPPYAHTKPTTTLVFDFLGGNGDRFLFPRNAILDYLPSNLEVLASFLILRPGSSTPLSKQGKSYYKASKQYYEPVTVRLTASHPKLLEPLAKAVNPPEEVRRYMDGVFDKHSPAQRVFLPLRLPREKEGEEGQDGGKVEGVKGKAEGIKGKAEGKQGGGVSYGPPNSMMPAMAKS